MKLTTVRLKRLIREELEKTIKEYRTKDDLEQMNGKVFIDKLTAQAQKLKSFTSLFGYISNQQDICRALPPLQRERLINVYLSRSTD